VNPTDSSVLGKQLVAARFCIGTTPVSFTGIQALKNSGRNCDGIGH
jgi:hypothetical protein